MVIGIFISTIATDHTKHNFQFFAENDPWSEREDLKKKKKPLTL